MVQSPDSGTYHDWRSFFNCPDCGSDDVGFDHYDDGTMFRCNRCGAEAWASSIVEKSL